MFSQTLENASLQIRQLLSFRILDWVGHLTMVYRSVYLLLQFHVHARIGDDGKENALDRSRPGVGAGNSKNLVARFLRLLNKAWYSQ